MTKRELADIADERLKLVASITENVLVRRCAGVLIRDQNRRQQRGGQYTQQAIALEVNQARSACLPKDRRAAPIHCDHQSKAIASTYPLDIYPPQKSLRNSSINPPTMAPRSYPSAEDDDHKRFQ